MKNGKKGNFNVLGETSYRYDRRGNLIQAIENGDIRHQYTYGALNRLERAVSGRGETARCQYNGLGYRTGKTEGRIQPETLKQMEENLNPLNQLKAMEPEPDKTIRYTIDLTRGYHNLLEREENQRSQIYLWDGNAAGFYDEGEESPQYYLQDELGSPLRIEGEDGRIRESCGYDEFGCDLCGNQGKVQPFGYTGYQQDTVAGNPFNQGGRVPKITDITTPGKSIEFPPPWIEEYATNGRIIKGASCIIQI